jgi:hypothetical protein
MHTFDGFMVYGCYRNDPLRYRYTYTTYVGMHSKIGATYEKQTNTGQERTFTSRR